MPAKYTLVDEKPKCDICQQKQADYDGRTIYGTCAFMCLTCFKRYGVGLGIDKGQRLKVRKR